MVYLGHLTHYAHKNICRGVSEWDIVARPDSVRDFDTLSQMNDKIVNNINAKVGHDDCLIHVGDWSFGGFDKIPEFRSRIVCQDIILILGNHDHHIKKNKENSRDLFSHVSKLEEIQVGKTMFILSHWPLEFWEYMKEGSFMIHGHLHNSGEKRFKGGRKMDVGMDGSPDFSPYHIDEIVHILERRTNDDSDRHHKKT